VKWNLGKDAELEFIDEDEQLDYVKEKISLKALNIRSYSKNGVAFFGSSSH
jgi:hypothetical protein